MNRKHTQESKDKMAASHAARGGMLRNRFSRNNPNDSSARNKEYLVFYKGLVFNHYGAICACCGEDNILFLSVDHVFNDGFLDKNSSGKKLTGQPLYMKIVKENFGPRYQILCMNCNHGKRMNSGVCPHISLKNQNG